MTKPLQPAPDCVGLRRNDADVGTEGFYPLRGRRRF